MEVISNHQIYSYAFCKNSEQTRRKYWETSGSSRLAIGKAEITETPLFSGSNSLRLYGIKQWMRNNCSENPLAIIFPQEDWLLIRSVIYYKRQSPFPRTPRLDLPFISGSFVRGLDKRKQSITREQLSDIVCADGGISSSTHKTQHNIMNFVHQPP